MSGILFCKEMQRSGTILRHQVTHDIAEFKSVEGMLRWRLSTRPFTPEKQLGRALTPEDLADLTTDIRWLDTGRRLQSAPRCAGCIIGTEGSQVTPGVEAAEREQARPILWKVGRTRSDDDYSR